MNSTGEVAVSNPFKSNEMPPEFSLSLWLWCKNCSVKIMNFRGTDTDTHAAHFHISDLFNTLKWQIIVRVPFTTVVVFFCMVGVGGEKLEYFQFLAIDQG